MRPSFILRVSDVPPTAGPGASVPHYVQQTGFSCGAASMSMITGYTEAECRRLARTTSSGTRSDNVLVALRESGFQAHLVRVDDNYDDHVVELVEQSRRWPLYLVLEFKNKVRDRGGRMRSHSRYHAVVMSGGQILDPGSFHPVDPEAMGDQANAGIRLREYILVEKPSQPVAV